MKNDEMKLFIYRTDPARNREFSTRPAGAGELFAKCFKDELCYVDDLERWYRYDHGVWCPCSKATVMEMIVDFGKVLLHYADKLDGNDRFSYANFAYRWQELPFVSAVSKFAAAKNHMPSTEFDRETRLLNCSNGTIDLKSMRFNRHDPADHLSMQTGTEYDPDAHDDRFESFLSEITNGDQERLRFLQKAFGYALEGENERECMFWLYGPTTRNGKSTLTGAVLGTLGRYGTGSLPDLFYAQRFSNPAGPSEHFASLQGIRYCALSEPEREAVLGSSVKLLTGNDSFKARNLREHFSLVTLHAVFFMSLNTLPIIQDDSALRSNRIIVIPFDRHFEPHEQQVDLKRRFNEPHCRSAILNWLIEGYRLYKQEGLEPPESVKNATENYRLTGGDGSIQSFMQQIPIPAEGETVSVSALYMAYLDWCAANHRRSEAMVRFSQQLKALGYDVIRARPKNGGNKTTLVNGYTL